MKFKISKTKRVNKPSVRTLQYAAELAIVHDSTNNSFNLLHAATANKTNFNETYAYFQEQEEDMIFFETTEESSLFLLLVAEKLKDEQKNNTASTITFYPEPFFPTNEVYPECECRFSRWIVDTIRSIFR